VTDEGAHLSKRARTRPASQAEIDALIARHADKPNSPANWPSVEDVMTDGDHRASTGALLLDAVAEHLGRYVAFPTEHALYAVALWVAHTHCIDAFESTPRLVLVSPEKQSGKTRTLEVLEDLVPKPMHLANTTAAALFRQVAADRPTLLMDEADTYLGPHVAKQHEELRAFVNAGHRRGAKAYRCVGEPAKMRVEAFPAYAALALAAIGDLPDTVTDRAVVVRMKRRRTDHDVEPYRARKARPLGKALQRRLATWTKSMAKSLRTYEPTMPEGITDRPADVWECLLGLADMAGGWWPKRAREACVRLNADRHSVDTSLGLRLLADVRQVFGDDGVMFTTTTLERLNALDDAPWGNLRGRPLDARGLSRRLARYDVRSKTVRVGDTTAKGYQRDDFADPWDRYLPPFESLPPVSPNGSVTSVTSVTPTPEIVTDVTDVTDAQGETEADTCATCQAPLKADGYCAECDT
jgi:hypothetical protein